MRILIVNPPDENTIIENPDEEGGKFLEADSYGSFPPLGALSVFSYLQEKNQHHQLYFLDCVGERYGQAKFKAYIKELMPDVVGFSSFTVGLLDLLEAARTVRELMPKAHLCLGGHHSIAFPWEAASLPEFDSIVVGEGEVAFYQLIQALDEGGDITAIQGVYTWESIQRFRENKFTDKRFLPSVCVPPAYIENLDDLPNINRQPIQHITYHNILGVTNKLATLYLSRGCPFKCTFCDVPYKEYRRRSLTKVLDEVATCLEMGYEEFRFYDDLFCLKAEDLIAFCDAVDRRGLKFVWDFRGRVNAVTREALIRGKKSGLRMAAFGVETGSDEGMRFLKKGCTIQQVRQAFQWCRELGILSVADYIIGFPFEKSIEAVRCNLKFLIDLDPDYAQINVLKLYPNTALHAQAVAAGVIQAGRWHEFARRPTREFVIDHWEEYLDLNTLVKLQKEGYRQFYFRPRYIWRSLRKTRSFYELVAKIGGALKILR